MKDKILENIIKDCYWDSDIQVDDLKNILKHNDDREMKKLFSKIIYNSKDKLLSLELFKLEQLKQYFNDFQVTYNKKYITKHVLILKSLILDEAIHIKSLEWKKA
ncbi:MAG: hypothetical protein U9N33_09850 [Campylobacterota bacterium]|nr:hypothetical protein [Campylobacterota bacterium]